MKKKKQFLKVPTLDGGNTNFKKFVEENLKYPDEAIKNNIEGTVYLNYTVDDYGNLLDVVIEKGIGYGCDEEAIRLIKLQKFSKVKNKGVRVKISQKAKITFNLKKHLQVTTINYSVTTSSSQEDKTGNSTYSYTVKIE